MSHIYLIGMNHRGSSVAVRERFALSDPMWRVKRPVPITMNPEGINEAVVISTCNRVEIIVVGQGDNIPESALHHWAAAAGAPVEELRDTVYILKDLEAVEHLFRVASSLESMIIGEPQILGQIKDAFRLAVELGTAKAVLTRLFHKAFFVAKLIRSETDIAARAVSVSFAACELARRIFGDMSRCRALLIGAGEMAELAARHLLKGGIESLCICNRTQEKAEELAGELCCFSLPFTDLSTALGKADVVISSTGSASPIITKSMTEDIMRGRRHRAMFFIDIAVPRDIDPGVHDLDNVYLYNIDDLKSVVEENTALRREEADKAAWLIKAEVRDFAAWLEALDLRPAIADLVRRGERIAEEELNKTLRRIGPIPEETEAALRDLLAGVLKKLNHDPIAFLNEQPMGKLTRLQYVALVRRIFNLDGRDDLPAPSEEESREIWKK